MTPPRNPTDHRAWLEYWGDQLVAAIRDAIARPDFVHEDYRLRYVYTCALLVHRRALQARPSLKEGAL